MTQGLRDAVAVLTTGPVPAYPAVLRAMSRPIPFDHEPPFQGVYEATAQKAATALRCAEPPVILQFEAAPGLEACVASLVGPSDIVLNLVSGSYGAAIADLCRRHAREVVELVVPSNDAIAPEQVADALRQRPETSVVAVVHHETPSGTVNPVNAIGRVVRNHGALLLVDAVSSFGGMDVDPDACCADVFVTSPAKCLGGTPGLTLVAVSERGWAHIEANPGAPKKSVLSVLDWRHAWKRNEPFPFTPSIAEIHGLDAALDLYLAEGRQEVWDRHALTARACRAGLRGLGLRLWPARDAIASPTSTVVCVPDGVAASDVLCNARRLLGVVLSPGRGAMQNAVVRIAHMGPTAEPAYAVLAVTAIAAALRRIGADCETGRGMEADFGLPADQLAGFLLMPRTCRYPGDSGAAAKAAEPAI